MLRGMTDNGETTPTDRFARINLILSAHGLDPSLVRADGITPDGYWGTFPKTYAGLADYRNTILQRPQLIDPNSPGFVWMRWPESMTEEERLTLCLLTIPDFSRHVSAALNHLVRHLTTLEAGGMVTQTQAHQLLQGLPEEGR